MFKNLRSIFRIFILASITVVLGGILIKLDYDHALETPNSEDSSKVSLTVEEGETTDEILESLAERDLLRESWLKYAKIYLRLKDLSSSLQAGTYSLPKNLNILEIIETLQSGQNPDIWITIIEGLRKDQIADLFVENIPNFSKEEFLTLTVNTEFINTLGLIEGLIDLEGYLFPAKYAFSAEVTEEEAIKKMTDNFITKVGLNDSYEDIIVASIVEREGYDNEDRPIIAGIVLKRYREGWTLGLSTTTLYYLKTWDEDLITAEDLEEDNEYNTYINVGYPPTPISNPGLESIEAMRNPVETDYYYFIRGNDNVTHYGVTYDDHLENITNYLN